MINILNKTGDHFFSKKSTMYIFMNVDSSILFYLLTSRKLEGCLNFFPLSYYSIIFVDSGNVANDTFSCTLYVTKEKTYILFILILGLF